MMPVVAGALSPDRQEVIKMWKNKMTPCTTGSVNNTETMVLRDTGSTTCVVRSSLVKPEQMTGSYELCMLIDGQGHCGACRRKWQLTDTDLCPCGETQTMSHIVESCPLTKLNGGLSRLHSADEDAVSWLTNYGK